MSQGTINAVSAQDRRAAHATIVITSNTEYFLVDATCVAVRDRGTGSFLNYHPAIGLQQGKHIVRGRRDHASWMPNAGFPQAGELLELRAGHTLVCTSPVLSVERRVGPWP